MKDFEQCCNEVAKKYGLQDWSYVHMSWLHNNWDLEKVNKLEEEAAKLYAKEIAMATFELARLGGYEGPSTYAKYVFDHTEREVLKMLKLNL